MVSRWIALAGLLLGCAPSRPAAQSPAHQPARFRTPPIAVQRPPRPVPTPSGALDRAIVEALRSDAVPASARERDDVAPDTPMPRLVRDRSARPSEPASSDGVDPEARLPPESIQRVVRTSAGRFRNCYQRALIKDPHVGGQISTWFVIGGDGLVDLVEEESATLPDREARACVMRAFFELHFPRPPGRAPITVLYPMRFGELPTGPQPLPSARKIAEPPPPGFAERLRNGIRVEPDPVILPFEDAAPPEPRPPSRCASGDPICPDL